MGHMIQIIVFGLPEKSKIKQCSNIRRNGYGRNLGMRWQHKMFEGAPIFDSTNPYWNTERFLFVRPEYRPTFTAHDFLFATTWELWKRDIHGAYCVRSAMQRSFWVNLRFGRLKYTEKEKVNEKVA
jgi:hypothetical protein